MVAQHPASPRSNPLLAAALLYAARDWRVFPLQPNTKIPFPGSHGFLDATTDVRQIRAWWTRHPRANIGIATGDELVVIDEDTYKGADLSGWLLPVTLTVATARGGRHRYFACDRPLPTVAEGKLGPGVLVRATGGYVVAPPSRFEGKPYAWVDADQPIATLPRRISDLFLAHASAGATPREERPRPAAPASTRGRESTGEYWVEKAVERARGTGRNNAGLWLAQQLVWNDCMDPEGAMCYYARLVEEWERPAYTEREALASLRQAQRHPKREPARSQRPTPPTPSRVTPIRSSDAPSRPAADGPAAVRFVREAPTMEQPEGDLHCTDMGNARRFVQRHGADVRYVAAWKQWLIWDGRRWRLDDTDQAMRLAKATVKSMWHEVGDLEDDEKRKEFVKWIYRSEAHSRLQAMLAQAQSEPEVAASALLFDANPWLLNVANGTLDLKSGALHPHRREDLLTKLAPVAYDAAAVLPLWDDFLATVTEGNQQLMDFLRRAVGYTLTGETSEEKLFFTHGPSRTGKSTFLEAVKACLGDYAMTADFDTFVARPSSGGPRDDVADMVGARMVASIEVDDGKKLAEGLVKMLTGGDTVKTRHLYQRGFEFKPAFKLWLAANHAPRVDAGDDAMWNRILRIGFNHVMTPAERKPGVKLTLRNPAKAGPAILAWAVRGCLEWQREGLGVPQEVEAATDAYRESMDPLKDFLADCCELSEGRWTAAGTLRETYEKWCKANGERFPLSGKKFAEILRRRGCEVLVRRQGNTTIRGWQGLGIEAEI